MAHLFHHNKEAETVTPAQDEQKHHIFHHNKEAATPQDELKHHKHYEHIGQGVGLCAGTAALYEKHQAKKDVGHAHKHKIKEEIAATGAVLAGGYVFHQHHEKKGAKKDVKAEKKAEKKHHF